MKQPKFTGIRKAYHAIWVGDSIIFPKIRKLNDKGYWFWDYANDDQHNWYNQVCWLKTENNLNEQIKEMENYDKRSGRETIFLGYIKVGK